MDQGPLVNEEIEAGERLIRRFDHFASVAAAFWLKVSDEPLRYLFIATKSVEADGARSGYLEIGRLVREPEFSDLGLFRVKLVGLNNRIAKAVIDLQKRYPASAPKRMTGVYLGDVMVDDIYIYPMNVGAANIHATVP